jgi:hypothetical protein
MEPEDERERPSDEQPAEQKGKLLRPSTTGVLKQSLNHYLAKERDFVGVYFPLIAVRGYATYDDAFQLTDTQADALRPILSESIAHFFKEDGREKNRNVGLLDRKAVEPNFESRSAKKAKLWTEALRDLCTVFGLESPR